MKAVLLISLLLALSCAFTLLPTPQLSMSNSELKIGGNLKACSSSQINTAYKAISSCEVFNIFETSKCLLNYMSTNLGQQWDVYAKESYGSGSISYWYYNYCFISLNSYGIYGRQFIMWPSQNYAGENMRNVKKESNEHAVVLNSNQAQMLGDCLSWRVTAVNLALSACDFYSLDLSASGCVMDYMKDNYGEYWDALIVKDNYAAASWWSYDGCSLSILNYGSQKRSYYVWKAY